MDSNKILINEMTPNPLYRGCLKSKKRQTSKLTKKQGFESNEKNWQSLDCQFCYVMGDTVQTPLCFHLFFPPEGEPPKTPILFNPSKNTLRLHTSS